MAFVNNFNFRTLRNLPKFDFKRYYSRLPKIDAWKHFNDLCNNTLFQPTDPVNSKKTLRGKTIVIIGDAMSDIAQEIVIKIARLHAFKIIIGVRDIEEGNNLKAIIEQETLICEHLCVFFELDMTSYPSIEQFANNVQNATERVHAVLLYTDLHLESVEDEYGEITRSSHGTELQLQVNVLSTAYLAIFFLPLLLETALAEGSPTHLEFVGCERYDHRNYAVLANFWEQSILQHLNKYPEDHFQYQATKFLQMGIMVQLAKRVDPSKIIIFDAEPGLCEKPIWKGPASDLSPWDKFYKRAFARTIEAGSRTVVKGLLKGPILWHNFLQGNVYRAGWAAITPPRRYEFFRNSEQLTSHVWFELMVGFRRMRNWKAIKNILIFDERPAAAFRLETVQYLRRWHPRYNGGGVKVYPLSSDDCKRFWGETLKSILPDKYYDGPGLLKPYPWAATTEVTVTVDPQNTEDSGEGNSNGEGSSTGEGSSNGNKSFADVWRCCDEKKIKLPVNQSEQGWNEVEEEVTYEGKGKAKLVEVVESWMSADVFDELTPTTLSPSDSLESEA